MPMCMCASTHPGKPRRFRASTISFESSARSPGASCANRPSLIPTSSDSTDALLGLTTQTFLTRRSNGLGITVPFIGIVFLSGREHGVGAEQALQRPEVEHAIAEGPRRTVRFQTGEIFGERERHR